jgi:dihydrolipoamide dehydrogenase
MKTFDVAIVGAGTSGLTARREVAKKTNDYVVIDDGPLGTTCARVGCMPSKVLIQVANDFARRKVFDEVGIRGGEALRVDSKTVMEHVRKLRDRFVRGVKNPMQDWEDKLIRGRAQFVDAHTLLVNDQTLRAEKIILALGSRPIIPGPFQKYPEHLLTTDEFFELPELPQKVAVVGLGVIGLELGQALHNLGVEVVGVTIGKALGGLTDPQLQNYVVDKILQEFPIHTEGGQPVGVTDAGRLQLEVDGQVIEVDKVLMAAGRRPNVDRVCLDKVHVNLDERGLPAYDPNTMKLKEQPHIFLPGDVNSERPLLHEASDEGTIAGHNAVSDETCFKRRELLAITFSEPNIATVGTTHRQLEEEGVDFVTGVVSFEGQGRSIVKLKEQGLLHIYADRQTGRLLGAELQAPDGEHLAHLLAWALSLNLTAQEALRMPFYHPVVEEGLRTALRSAAKQLAGHRQGELYRCEDPPIR